MLDHLLAAGMGRVDIRSSDASRILKTEADKDLQKGFADVIIWMINEGLIRNGNLTQTLDGNSFFMGVQLTSRGLAILNQERIGAESQKSIEKTLEDGKGELAPSVYVKIGAAIGGALGGFTKAIS
jgi:hypothetical protein